MNLLFSTSKGITIAGSDRYGTFHSSDGGQSWAPIESTSRPYNQIAEHPNGNLFAPDINIGLSRSTDGGVSWDRLSIPNESMSFPQDVTIDNDGTIFMSGIMAPGCTRCGSYPRIWTSADEGLTDKVLYAPSFNEYWNSKSLLHTPQGVLIASFNSSLGNTMLIRSIDSGSTWVTIGIGFPTNDYASALISTPSGKIFAGTSSHGVFSSTDNGISWQPMNSGLSDVSINSMIRNSAGYLYAGTNTGGIFCSTDGGENWIPINHNLTDFCVLSLSVDTDGYLYAGTGSSGVWRSISPTEIEHNVQTGTPKEFMLYQNYPNPFNPTTTITYSIPKPGHVIVKVFNMLGEEIETLIDDNKSPGNYQVSFNGGRLSSGIYFYRIQTGIFSKTRPMIFLK
jgi:hypothetical protein